MALTPMVPSKRAKVRNPARDMMDGGPMPGDVDSGYASDNDGDEHKVSSDAAGYLELDGAVKDADCEVVMVDGGVSSDRGCCNLWSDAGGADTFSCGTCMYVEKGQEQPDETQMTAGPQEESSGMAGNGGQLG